MNKFSILSHITGNSTPNLLVIDYQALKQEKGDSSFFQKKIFFNYLVYIIKYFILVLNL